MDRDERNGRDENRQQLPFEGLHVYQRVQEAWAAAHLSSLRNGGSLSSGAADADPLRALIEEEVRQSALGIARATARSRTNGDFKAELETARGALHAAAAALDQAIRRGDAAQDELRTLIVDSSRMLGALIRSVSSSSAQTARAEAEEVAV